MNAVNGCGRRFAALLLLGVGFLIVQNLQAAWTVGDRIQTTSGVIVYQTPGSFRVGTQLAGSLGVAAAGPQVAGLGGTIYIWWNITFDSGSSGWVQQDYLTAIVPSAPALGSPGSLAPPGPGVNTLTPTFSWNTDLGATNYIIYVVDRSIGNLTIYYNDSLGTVTSHLLPGGCLTVDHNYYWVLRAQDSVGFSDYSSPFYFQVQTSAPPVPVQISPGTASSPGPKLATLTPTLTWNATSSATGYGVYVYDFAGHAYVYSNDSVGNVTSFALPGGTLAPSRSYAWQMRASNVGGFSGYSSFLYFQTPAAPPTLLFQLGDNKIVLSWPTNSTGFALEASASLSAVSWTPVSPAPSLAGTNYVVTNDLSGFSKVFRLKK